jgi:pyridoxal phosphate enzyme (YggS family)
MTITQTNLLQIRQQLPAHVTLVAVSKTKPIPQLIEAYEAGQRIFGENKALEVRDKYEAMPKDIQWHFIGHLQTNKIKYIAPFVSLIHSVDSFKLLLEIDKAAKKCNRIIPCLLQFYIAEEETKFGFDLEEAIQMLRSPEFKDLQHVEIAGVMGMATFTDNRVQIVKEFRHLSDNFHTLKNTYFAGQSSFKEISMGMTDDFDLAIAEGSTLVRVGSAIFGNRIYNP